MADIEYDITDPRSDWYSPANQSSIHESGMLEAIQEGRTDELTQFDRYRTWPKPLGYNPIAEETGLQRIPIVKYATKVPPWFFDAPSQQLMGNPDPNILPLNVGRDPNYAYSQYAAHDRLASNLNDTWKVLANMPTSPLDDEDMKARRENALESLSDKFNSATKKAEEFKRTSLSLQDAYNRQILIQGLRGFSPLAHQQAQEVEQASRDFAEIDFGIGSGRIPDTKLNDELRNRAMLKLEESMGRWDAGLEKRGLTGPKGPYLLSGVPAQFLDDIADRGARDLRLTNEKIKMFQSRYVNDAPFRASVNQGLKAKVPGILAAGIGGALVKQKMNEGESLPKAVGTTAGDIVLGATKFALMDRFVGPVGELNQGENEYLQNRDKVKFVQQLDDAQMAELEKDFPHLKREQAKVAKVLRERMAESKAVEDNITNSPLWNIAK